MKDPVYAYVIMRNDLDSLNAGKAAAHAHHAGTRMVHWIEHNGSSLHKKWFKAWKEEDGVGVCIVLSASHERTWVSVREAINLGLPAGMWTDPTYPSTTPRGFHLLPMDVCAWFLAPKSKLQDILGDLPLMN